MKTYSLDEVRNYRYTPTDEYLPNPHRGCCTFQKFNGDELFTVGVNPDVKCPLEFPPPKHDPAAGTPGYLRTTVAYCRWFWSVMEPEEGKYDFSMIDKALQTAGERGQTLAVRLMPYGWIPEPQPSVPDWYSRRYPMCRYLKWKELVPDLDAPEYFEHWGNLVREFARRYDDHPLLETIDVSFIGPWGEGSQDCSPEHIDQFAELWQKAFKHTPRLALIAGDPATGDQMLASTRRGSGWRADAFGDVLGCEDRPDVPVHCGWSHMFNYYPQRICEIGAQETWRTGPVHFEIGWLNLHAQLGVDWDFIIEQGYKYHATCFLLKSFAIPEPWMDKLARFSNRIGYRYVFRQATLSKQVSPRGRFLFRAWIENVGVAPLYRRYDFALRLRQDGRQVIIPLADVNVREWIPGDACIDREVPMPEGFGPGGVEVSAGLIDPKTQKPCIHFAVKERFPDRWLGLGTVELRSA